MADVAASNQVQPPLSGRLTHSKVCGLLIIERSALARRRRM